MALEGNGRFWNLSLAPPVARRVSKGDLWYDSAAEVLKICTDTDPATWAPVTSGEGPGGSVSWGDILGTLANQTDLQAALDGKATASHTHAISAITNLQTTLDGKAASAHGHAVEDVTGLQTQLDGKAALSHTHDASAIVSGVIDAARLPPSEGGADPWTYLRLTSDFPTTSNTAVNITGLAFTPAANTRYEFEASLLLRTATATVGPRPGIAWPTGGTDGVGQVRCTSAAGTEVLQNGNIAASILGPVGGLPNTTASWPAWAWGVFLAGASPSGTVRLQIASETNGTQVTVKAGSFLRYRTIP